MKQFFKVGDQVFASVNGFIPFPAVVENVLLNESNCSVFYYIRFRGASKTVPVDAENLKPLDANKYRYKLKYTDKELKKESKLRVDSLLGAEDEIPEVLMNFVTVDSDFEEVSEDGVKKLGLGSIILTPSMLDSLDRRKSSRKVQPNVKLEADSFVDVEDTPPQESDRLSKWRKLRVGLSCRSCHKIYKSSIALKAHQRQNSVCRGPYQKLSAPNQNRSLLKSSNLVPVDQNRSLLKSSNLVPVDQNRSLLKSSNLVTVERQPLNPDPIKTHNEDIVVDKSMWASRSASGFYPCKLCFRKFRSKGEAQYHMSSHKHQRFTKTVSPESSISQDSEDSLSVDDEGFDKLKHNSLERYRRAVMAEKFAELAEVAGIEKRTAKVQILHTAKMLIADLETESDQQDQQIAVLQQENERLRAQYFELDPE